MINLTALTLQMTRYLFPALLSFCSGPAWLLRREAGGHPSWWNAGVFLMTLLALPLVLGPPQSVAGMGALIIPFGVGFISGLILRVPDNVPRRPKASRTFPFQRRLSRLCSSGIINVLTVRPTVP
jgi:hypothetical protein